MKTFKSHLNEVYKTYPGKGWLMDGPDIKPKDIQKVYDDKLIEAYNGHDGSWVAHPGLVSTTKSVFDNHLYFANQIGNLREDISIKNSDLLKLPVKTAGGRTGRITEKGLRMNINIGILYIEAWLRGNGCVPLYNLMEDAATAEQLKLYPGAENNNF